jgi:hypothetical protein
MKFQTASTFTLIAAALTLATAPAQAFTGFTFSTKFTPTLPSGSLAQANHAKNDIILQSVTLGSGQEIGQSELSLVQSANILVNNVTTGANQGPGSSDHGDLVNMCPKNELPSAGDVAASLGNFNLNCIIDTEDNLGESKIDVFFSKGVNTFFFFERGINSDLMVEALDDAGNVIGSSFKITEILFGSKPAGYSLNTTEIGNPQAVGSYGLKLGYNVAGLRLSSDIGFNGPDYKVVAARVPEPATIAGLGMVAGTALLARRKKNQAAQ